jgi:hypothetical protein
MTVQEKQCLLTMVAVLGFKVRAEGGGGWWAVVA